MSETEQLQKAIDLLEAQRAVLGDAVVDLALAPLYKKLAVASQEQVKEQRKLVTVLFADLVGFTSMSEQMDPEDVREVLRVYFPQWAECVERWGGEVEKFIGDAVMAVFGLRTAREDDSERAIRAALEMREAFDEMNERFERTHGIRLAMRIGIHTGQVVVSLLDERKGQDFVVVGDTVNLASRLQSAAPPNGILIAQETFHLVRGVFDFQELEAIRVKGKRNPVQVYLVVRAKSVNLRFERPRTHIPLVGRENALTVLQEFFERTVQLHCQHSVLILGEAGMGKSRLIDEFETRMELLPQYIRYFKGRSNPYLKQQPYGLIRDLLSHRMHIQDNEEPASVMKKLVEGLGDEQAAKYVGQLLGFFTDGDLPDARQLRDRALAYLVTYFRGLAESEPVVFVLEDLQWADDSSMELVAALQRELEQSPVLGIATARPDVLTRVKFWDGAEETRTRIFLQPLNEAESLRLLRLLLGQFLPHPAQEVEEVASELARLVTTSAEGNPFYMEELLRMLIEDQVIVPQGKGWQVLAERLAAVRVPPTLAEFLQARLDSLPVEERLLLQRAAVVGRVFWDQAVDYLRHQAGSSAPDGQQPEVVLSRLRQVDIVLQRDVSHFEGMGEYLFAHNLFRDVTYESLLKRQRRIYHAHTARWLEMVTEHSRHTDEYAGVIAEHYAQAEENEPAVNWFRRAGKLAFDRYGNQEAIHHFSRALELLPVENEAVRFDLLGAREQVYDRIAEREAQANDLSALETLAEKLNDAYRRAQVYVRRTNLSFYLGENEMGISAAQQALEIAGETDTDIALQAHLLWGRMLLWQNENEGADSHLQMALGIARQTGQVAQEAACLANLGILSSNITQYEESLERLQQALALYRQVGNPEDEALVNGQIGNVYYFQGDYEQANQRWEMARELFHRTGHRLREATMLGNLGSIASDRGDFREAYQLMTQALRTYRDANDRSGMATMHTNLGNHMFWQGLYEQANEHYEQAIRLSIEVNDRFAEVPALANRSMLRVALGQVDGAIVDGEEAVRLARAIQASMFEGFALTQLGRAYLESGRLDDAEQTFRQGLDLQQQLETENHVVDMQTGLAQVALVRGDRAAARAWVECFVEKIETGALTTDDSDDPSSVVLTAWKVVREADAARAQRLLQRGKAAVLAKAERIEEPEHRQAFLSKVAANRELLSFAS